jgi:hydrogenase-4 component B
MTLFLLAVSLLFSAAIPGALSRNGSLFWERCALVLTLIACLLGLAATVNILYHPAQGLFIVPWCLVPGAVIALKLDALSAAFLLPALLVTAAGSLYGSGYWSVTEKGASGAWLRFFYPILAGAIVLVLCSNNVFLFLMSWETMALAGYFLVITERQKEEAHSAGFIYLVATHAGTLALCGCFALLLQMAPGDFLPTAASLAGNGWLASAVFLLALFGFGCKAGFIPLHIWLPGAHASAPSNVSALMSGVIIKMGIYGLLRITSFFEMTPLWWGQTILALGLISTIFGVVLAIAQHDIKRLLAYHSVENIGIILLGIGIALIGKSTGNEAMMTLGLAGALLHVINHGLFKALLFLSAGSMIQQTGTRILMRYGGLWKTMPATGFFFLGGSIAICGLPPLNGFVSEWLIYLGIFNSFQQQMPLITMLAAPGLAMTGGLALLCFTKVFGLSFLGKPRTSLPVHGDAAGSMLTAMALLFFCCLWIGLAPETLIPFLHNGTTIWNGGPVATPLKVLVSAGQISLAALSLLLIVLFLVMISDRRTTRHDADRGPTWGCGYANAIARVQYTTSSFAQIINNFFGWALRTDIHGEDPAGILPINPATCRTHTPDAILDHLLQPFCNTVTAHIVRLRRRVQNGIIGYYLLYTLIATCLLLMLT